MRLVFTQDVWLRLVKSQLPYFVEEKNISPLSFQYLP
jgi:hypothetical protein